MQGIEKEIFAKDQASYLPVFSRYAIVLDHGDGVYVYDTNGRQYLDFLGGIAVNVLGHAHPYGRRLLGLKFCASLALTRPLNLPAPGRRQPLYLSFRFSRDLCFC